MCVEKYTYTCRVALSFIHRGVNQLFAAPGCWLLRPHESRIPLTILRCTWKRCVYLSHIWLWCLEWSHVHPHRRVLWYYLSHVHIRTSHRTNECTCSLVVVVVTYLPAAVQYCREEGLGFRPGDICTCECISICIYIWVVIYWCERSSTRVRKHEQTSGLSQTNAALLAWPGRPGGGRNKIRYITRVRFEIEIWFWIPVELCILIKELLCFSRGKTGKRRSGFEVHTYEIICFNNTYEFGTLSLSFWISVKVLA